MADGEHALRAHDAPRTPSAALAEVERALLAENVLVERITSVPGTFPVGRISSARA